MSDRRRAEIELKRAKLAELRKARDERKKLDEIRKSGTATPSGAGARAGGDVDEAAKRDEERMRVEDIVQRILGEDRPSSGRRNSAASTPVSTLPSTPAPGNTQLGPSGLGLIYNGTRSVSQASDTSEARITMNNTMVQVGGDAGDRWVHPAFVMKLVE